MPRHPETPDGPDDPDGPPDPTAASVRYGRAAPAASAARRRLLVVATAVLLVAGVGYAVWFGAGSRDQASVRTQGYEVVDDTRTEVTFTVSKPPGSTADCQVEALSSGSAQVGLVTVEVGPADTTASTVRVALPTSERATTGQPVRCDLR